MRLLVHESICAGDLSRSSGPPAPPSLLLEGAAMLRSIASDAAAIHRVRRVAVVVHRSADAILGALPAGVERLRPGSASTFADIAAGFDHALVIAPETRGLLERRSREALDAGLILLGAGPDAVALCADKVRLAAHLVSHDVPCARHEDAREVLETGACQSTLPAVLKPRDGAGAIHTARVDSIEALRATHDALVRAGATDLVVSPWCQGTAASASFLVGPGRVIALAPGRQRITIDRDVRYEGGEIPLEESLARRATELGARAVGAVQGLRGFVGVDVVLGETRDVVVEMNPRVTTSIVGLRALYAPLNLFEHWLGALRAPAGVGPESLAAPRGRRVAFGADGRVRTTSGTLKPGSSRGQ